MRVWRCVGERRPCRPVGPRILALGALLAACGPDEDIRITPDFDGVMPPAPVPSSCSLDGVVYAPEPSVSTRVARSGAADPMPHFSFFVTSQAGLYSLPAGEHAPLADALTGFGGNLGGLEGADEICRMLAQRANPGDSKTWRAFLSASGTVHGERVDAIGRIGPGPWYDFNGRLLAPDLAGLLPDENGRPNAAAPQLADMFSDENGESARLSGQDNHDMLTGSNACGRLHDDGMSGRVATCEDWTSNTMRGRETDMFGNGGQVPVGHSWPRAAGGFGNSSALGAHWIRDHFVNGCEPGFDVDGGAGAPANDFRVGAGGGYGGFYCFALGALDP